MATVETMNVHQALCEIKLLDKRISAETVSLMPIAVTKKAVQMVNSQTVEQFKADASAQYQKVLDLIKRRAAIKRAVVRSNASTTVIISDKEYTIAEAIEMKNHGLDGKRELRNRLSAMLQTAEMNISRTSETNETKADNYIREVFGGKDNKGGSAEIQAARDNYLAGIAVELVDAIGIRHAIKGLDDEIHKFEAEVDSALSTSNATTELTIEY